MATYTAKPFLEGAHYSRVGTQFAYREPTRIYATGDILKLLYVERDTKIMWAALGASQLDSNGASAVTATLRLNNGSTQVNIVVAPATTLRAATGGVTALSEQAALGYIVPARGYWLEVLFGTFTTAVTGIVSVSLQMSNVMYGTESPLAPTGS